MAKITVYTTQGRLRYSAQIPCIRPKRKTPTTVDLSQALCLMRHPDSGEYLQAPVIYAGPDNHFCGFRPDRIKALTAAAA